MPVREEPAPDRHGDGAEDQQFVADDERRQGYQCNAARGFAAGLIASRDRGQRHLYGLHRQEQFQFV